MSLRILHVTPYFAGAWAYGGIPRVAAAQSRALARRGHQVTVCTTDACDGTSRLPPGWTDREVDVHVFPNLSNRLAYRWQCYLPRGFRRFLDGAIRSFDLVHIHSHRHALQRIAVDLCRRAGVPYVLGPNGTAPRLERRVTAKRLWDVTWGDRDLKDAAAVLAVSPSERRQLAALGVAADRLCEVPNPIELDEFPGARTTPVAERAGRRPPLIAFLGKITPRKRLDVVVRAVPLIDRPDARLAIAGSDMGGLSAALALAEGLGVAGRVEFHGLLTGPERLAFLAAADVVVYPSTAEAFGLVPLEALLSSTPVVVADDAGCAEVVGPLPGSQVVAAGDAAALARAVDRVLAGPRDWQSAAASAGGAIRARYGSDVVAAALDAVYRRVLAH